MPGTYPPRPLNGVLVSCFLTPSVRSQYTYPMHLRKEVEQVVGEYMFDCTNFRTEDKDDLLRQIYEMTDRRFALADHLLETQPWDFFAMVEMGVDRIYHGFWKAMDPAHRKHVPGNPYESAIKDYHRHVDRLLAKVIEHADDETVILVVSDHGGKRMEGGIRINEWLRREGLLATLQEPTEVTTLDAVGVDWSRTTAWGEGGYYSRVFLNVRGREPDGIVPAEDYERVRDELARRLAEIPDDRGLPMETRVYKPEDLYPEVNGVAPDLIVHFGDLAWRAVGTIGGDEGVHTFENDTGPDDANHAQQGLLVMAGPGIPHERRDDMHLLDVAPTVLDLLGHPDSCNDARLEPGLRRATASVQHRSARVMNPYLDPIRRFPWLVALARAGRVRRGVARALRRGLGIVGADAQRAAQAHVPGDRPGPRHELGEPVPQGARVAAEQTRCSTQPTTCRSSFSPTASRRFGRRSSGRSRRGHRAKRCSRE